MSAISYKSLQCILLVSYCSPVECRNFAICFVWHLRNAIQNDNFTQTFLLEEKNMNLSNVPLYLLAASFCWEFWCK